MRISSTIYNKKKNWEINYMQDLPYHLTIRKNNSFLNKNNFFFSFSFSCFSFFFCLHTKKFSPNDKCTSGEWFFLINLLYAYMCCVYFYKSLLTRHGIICCV